MNKTLTNGTLDAISDALEITQPDLLSRVEAQTEHTLEDHNRVGQLGVVAGIYQGRNDGGEPLVDFAVNPSAAPIAARSVVALAAKDIGREIVLVFDSGDVRRPIVLGLVEPAIAVESNPPVPQAVDVLVDGERVTIEAEKEIVLKCGEASITLTRAGKILLRGTYLLSRSSGANRIKGASIEMN